MTDTPRITEVTIGEVYRLALRIDQRLDSISRDMVGRQEYESDQESVERQLKALTDGLAEERIAREKGDKSIVSEATMAKRWAIGIGVTGIGALVTLFFFFNGLAGGGVAS